MAHPLAVTTAEPLFVNTFGTAENILISEVSSFLHFWGSFDTILSSWNHRQLKRFPYNITVLALIIRTF